MFSAKSKAENCIYELVFFLAMYVQIELPVQLSYKYRNSIKCKKKKSSMIINNF